MRNRGTLRLIERYQASVSPQLRSRCSYQVSCSHYAAIMYRRHRWVKASFKSAARISNCANHSRHRRASGTATLHRLGALVSLAVMGLGFLLLIAPPAPAGILEGSCEAHANTQNVAVNSIRNPLRVKEHTAIRLLGKSPQQTGDVVWGLLYFGTPFANTRTSFTGGTWSSSVPVDRYATYGVGSYSAGGFVYPPDSEDAVCSAELFVVVEGNPMETPVGKGAAAAELLGMGGLLSSYFAGSGRTRVPEGMRGDSGTTPEDAKRLETESEEARKQDDLAQKGGPVSAVDMVVDVYNNKVCAFLILPAILMTIVLAVGGTTLPRLRWKPRLSFIGILSGILCGISTIVLLQQYGIIFPTLRMGIAGAVGGLVIGILIPSLGKRRVVKRLNRRTAG